MVLKVNRKVRVRRGKKRLPPKTAKAVKAVVQRALRTNIETKARYVSMNNLNMYGGEMYITNFPYWIPNDTSLSGTVANQMKHCRLHVKGTFKNTGLRAGLPVTFPWTHTYLRLVVFKHNKECFNLAENVWTSLPAVTGTPITGTEILRGGADGARFHQTFQNPQECKFLFDKTIRCGLTSTHRPDDDPTHATYTPNAAGDISFDYTIRIGNIYRQAIAAAVTSLTRENIYMAVMASTPLPTPTGSDNISDLYAEYVLSWKDA